MLDLLKSIDLGAYYSFNAQAPELPLQALQLGAWLGGYPVVAFLLLAAIVALIAQGRAHTIPIVLATFVLAGVGAEILQNLLGAHRPDDAAKLVASAEMLRSFPAREVMTLTLAAMTLLFVLWPSVHYWMARAFLTAGLVVLVLWVAMSHLILGLNYVSDVEAGLFAGLALALIAGRLLKGTGMPHQSAPLPGVQLRSSRTLGA